MYNNKKRSLCLYARFPIEAKLEQCHLIYLFYFIYELKTPWSVWSSFKCTFNCLNVAFLIYFTSFCFIFSAKTRKKNRKRILNIKLDVKNTQNNIINEREIKNTHYTHKNNQRQKNKNEKFFQFEEKISSGYLYDWCRRVFEHFCKNKPQKKHKIHTFSDRTDGAEVFMGHWLKSILLLNLFIFFFVLSKSKSNWRKQKKKIIELEIKNHLIHEKINFHAITTNK